MKLRISTLTLLLCSALFTQAANAEIAVITHPSNASAMDGGAISLIFLGKKKSFPDGSQAVPVSQTEDAAPTAEFNDKILKKSSSQLKAYWSKLVFTGKGTPPRSVDNDAAVVSLVSSNPNIIGYVDASAVNDSVKVVATF
ncbi:type 2 periplasmic-binding domain-containing protein [Teredinibacter purpureus]|uniref:phosphate ABC transporter substrate-binding protein n=1 Tax=Teredinibacter purpureus TaxID=2731756 RepID=UPI0005F7CD00|nr:phosphate ABC transporter substrate-binding protein [Teredinibacter purpureus]